MGLSDKVVAAYMAANMNNSITKASSDYHPEDHNMHSRKYYTNTSVVIIGAGISGTLLQLAEGQTALPISLSPVHP